MRGGLVGLGDGGGRLAGFVEQVGSFLEPGGAAVIADVDDDHRRVGDNC